MKFKDLLECMSKIMKEVQLIRVVTDVYAKDGVLIVELE